MKKLLAYFNNFQWPQLPQGPQWMVEDYSVLPYVALFFVALLLLECFRRSAMSETLRQLILIGISVLLIGWLDLRSLLLMSALASIVYVLLHYQVDYRRHLLAMTAASIIALVGSKALLANWTPKPVVIIGLSYYVFRLISVLVEVGRDNPAYKNIKALPFFTYVFFFPFFLAGPVERLADFKRTEIEPQQVPAVYASLFLFLVVKIAFVDFLLQQAIIAPMRADLVPIVGSWPAKARIGLFLAHGGTSLVHGYLDLMIYTELAKCIGRLLGYHVVENFNYPLLATNIADFWRRWHISLSGWARDYVFMPVMVQSRNTWLASYATMLTIGLWHAANLNWVVWALAHGTSFVFYGLLRKTQIYRTISDTRSHRMVLGGIGWLTTLLFVSAIYNLVAFPQDYSLAWKFTRAALLGQ